MNLSLWCEAKYVLLGDTLWAGKLQEKSVEAHPFPDMEVDGLIIVSEVKCHTSSQK